MAINIDEMNGKLREAFADASEKFPDLDKRELWKLCKFAIFGGTAIREINRDLAVKGKQLSEKGLEVVLAESLKFVTEDK